MNKIKDSSNSSQSAILLFDGVCNLCNHFIQFIVKRDPQAQIHFASLQSESGQAILRKHQLPTEELLSVVLVEGENVYTHSTAALRALKILGFPWSWLYIFIVLPEGLRNLVYDWIAANRYRWFGKRAHCMLPDEELSQRFLD